MLNKTVKIVQFPENVCWQIHAINQILVKDESKLTKFKIACKDHSKLFPSYLRTRIALGAL